MTSALAPGLRLWWLAFLLSAATCWLAFAVQSFWILLGALVLFAVAALIVTRRDRPQWTGRRSAAFASAVLLFELLSLALGGMFVFRFVPLHVPSMAAFAFMIRPMWASLTLGVSIAVWVTTLPVALAAAAASFGVDRSRGRGAALRLLVVMVGAFLGASYGRVDLRESMWFGLMCAAAVMAVATVFLPREGPDSGAAPALGRSVTITDVTLVAAATLVVVLSVFPWMRMIRGEGVQRLTAAAIGLMWPLYFFALRVAAILDARRRGEAPHALSAIAAMTAALVLPVVCALVAFARLDQPWISR